MIAPRDIFLEYIVAPGKEDEDGDILSPSFWTGYIHFKGHSKAIRFFADDLDTLTRIGLTIVDALRGTKP